MTQAINEPVSVVLLSQATPKDIRPVKIKWRHHIYLPTFIGMHHTVMQGKVLCHIFSVTCTDVFLRLSFNTKNLLWTLESISDGVGE